MIAQNELSALGCNKRAVLETIAILLSPYAPHIAEEMWQRCGNNTFVIDAAWPKHDEKYLLEDDIKYPVQINGKMRFTISLPKTMDKAEVEQTILATEECAKYLNGNTPKRVIVVPGKIVNIVI
jgi:leucyl-tRNA synthetase